MASRVLLVQSDLAAAEPLAAYFAEHGRAVVLAADAASARERLAQAPVDLVAVDLHLPAEGWLDVIRETHTRWPAAAVLVTNRYPDLRRELLAKQLGCQVFLRQPFERVWIERALARVHAPGAGTRTASAGLPVVRLSVRTKIILPFALLAGVFALAAAYLISRYVTDSIQDRFDRQLADAATLTADWMVRTENRLLETERLVANTAGLAEALLNRDSARLRLLALPLAVNAAVSTVDLVSADGVSVLALRQAVDAPGGYLALSGDAGPGAWSFVRAVLAARSDAQGDKFAGLGGTAEQTYFFVAGPVFDPAGRLVGAVLVGQTLTALARDVRSNTLAQITFYAPDGQPLASTLPEAAEALAPRALTDLQAQPAAVFLRPLAAGSAAYSEAVTVWSARNGEPLGWAGTALAPGFLVQPTFLTQVQAFGLVLVGLALVVLIGWALARHITRPLGPMVKAARSVAQGNFQIKLQDGGDDEVAVLVHAFNQMVSGLQEGSIYRDLLGRTVSPEVREELRTAFESGSLRLEGQTVTATVLMSDIRGFTTLSEKSDPTVVLRWLNEYFSELVPVVTAHGGVVDKFEGDALLAFFGVLPTPLPPRESAYQACRAALEMLKVITAINARRAERGEPLFITGLGINTGPVTAGGLGAADRLNYTVIGDTVNTTQRLESFTRAFDESAAVISESTRAALRARQALFELEPLGGHVFKGKTEPIRLYRLLPAAPSAPAERPALQPAAVPVPAQD